MEVMFDCNPPRCTNAREYQNGISMGQTTSAARRMSSDVWVPPWFRRRQERDGQS